MSAAEKTVHLLWHGFAICQFSDKVPAEWPAGHVWMGVPDYIRGTVIAPENQYCSLCVDVARQARITGA